MLGTYLGRDPSNQWCTKPIKVWPDFDQHFKGPKVSAVVVLNHSIVDYMLSFQNVFQLQTNIPTYFIYKIR